MNSVLGHEWLVEHPELRGIEPRLFRMTLEQIESLRVVPHCRVLSSLFGWISDESIEAALTAGEFDDLDTPHTEQTLRNVRIASLVRLMQGGILLAPLTLRFRSKMYGAIHRVKLDLLDGNHRLRAYEFVGWKKPIEFTLYGSRTGLSRLLTKARWDAFPPDQSKVRPARYK